MPQASANTPKFKEESDAKHKEGEPLVEKYMKEQEATPQWGNTEIDPLVHQIGKLKKEN